MYLSKSKSQTRDTRIEENRYNCCTGWPYLFLAFCRSSRLTKNSAHAFRTACAVPVLTVWLPLPTMIKGLPSPFRTGSLPYRTKKCPHLPFGWLVSKPYLASNRCKLVAFHPLGLTLASGCSLGSDISIPCLSSSKPLPLKPFGLGMAATLLTGPLLIGSLTTFILLFTHNKYLNVSFLVVLSRY